MIVILDKLSLDLTLAKRIFQYTDQEFVDFCFKLLRKTCSSDEHLNHLTVVGMSSVCQDEYDEEFNEQHLFFATPEFLFTDINEAAIEDEFDVIVKIHQIPVIDYSERKNLF